MAATYGSIILINFNGDTQWKLEGTFSLEFCVGAAVVARYAFNLTQEPYYLIFTETSGKLTYDTHLINTSGLTGKSLKHRYGFMTQNTIAIMCVSLKEGYNVWLDNDETVNLYVFQTPDLLRGLFTMLRAFHVDYRAVIVSCPLKVTIQNGHRTAVYTEIQEYPLPFFPLVRQPHIPRGIRGTHEYTINIIDPDYNIIAESYKECNHILN